MSTYASIVLVMDRTTFLHETPERLCVLENVTKTSIDTVESSKWVEFQFCADHPFKLTWYVSVWLNINSQIFLQQTLDDK